MTEEISRMAQGKQDQDRHPGNKNAGARRPARGGKTSRLQIEPAASLIGGR